VAYNEATVLGIVKARLNRLDTALDSYLTTRIQAAAGELALKGIALEDIPEDSVLLADYVAWQHQGRDKPGGMPEWLRLRIRERWFAQERGS
jgi:hypothetical protein